METKWLTAERDYPRADLFVSENLGGYTRSAVRKLMDGGAVTLNGARVKASRQVACGERFQVDLPDPVAYEAKAENIPLDVVYQDDDVAVVNKPQGLTVHAGNGNFDGTLVNALLYHLDHLSGIGGVLRPGIVHRIDKNTSGLLLVAKNDAAHRSLAAQIEAKTCRRIYVALLEGNVKQESGTVSNYIGRSPTDRVKMAVVPPEKGKLAVTDYRVLARSEGYTLCEFSLHTGRTHQIRVHAKFLGHPVVGDDVYGFKRQKFGLQGQLLHACRINFTHPRTGEEMEFSAPLPDYFTDVLKKLKFDLKYLSLHEKTCIIIS